MKTLKAITNVFLTIGHSIFFLLALVIALALCPFVKKYKPERRKPEYLLLVFKCNCGKETQVKVTEDEYAVWLECHDVHKAFKNMPFEDTNLIYLGLCQDCLQQISIEIPTIFTERVEEPHDGSLLVWDTQKL